MRIISISGLDGSGKSTQIELLKKHLEAQGKKVLYFHAIQFSFAKKLQQFKAKYCLICKLMGKCRVSTAEERSITKANWLQIQLRKLFLLIDVLRFRRLAKREYASAYDYVLSDRYFFDSVLNIKYLSLSRHSERSEESRNIATGSAARSFANTQDDMFLKFAEKFIIHPDKAFYLEAEPAMIMQRKRIPDQGIEYLRAKRDIFENSIAQWNLERIDGNKVPEEVFEKILGEITKMRETRNKIQ